MMKDFNITIKAGTGKFNNLDKEYNNLITSTMANVDSETKLRWETYSIIMDELLNIDRIDCFEEAKYRLTDGEDPNKVMIDMIDRNKNTSGLLWFIRKRLQEYIEEDFYNRFL
jgi:hypothetical protein